MNSRDEMKTLSESFLSLEKAVIDYVDLIEKETKEKEKINAELSVASKIQLEALPSRSKDEPRFQLEAYIQPAKEVGGDFYDYFFLDPNRLVLIVSDVSGKGIPASLFMMKGKELLKANLLSETSLVKAIEKTNDQLCLNNAENLFITSFVGIIDFTSNTMSYVNAGHEKPYLIRGKEVTRLDGECNFVLGGYPSFPYKEESLALKKGDILFLFTDGLNEAIDEKEEEFGYARIENSLAQSEGKSLSERIKAMEEALSSFAKDQEGFDDVTMLFFLVKEEEGLHLLYQEKDYEIIAKAMKEFELRFASLPADFKSEVGIILDEVINNFVTYEAKKTLCIGIDFTLVNDCLQIVFSNDGDPFDPLKDHEDKYIEAYDDNLALGGFGISLVKNLSSEISYDYVDGKNVLTIKKKL